jgi:hypothetical protein
LGASSVDAVPISVPDPFLVVVMFLLCVLLFPEQMADYESFKLTFIPGDNGYSA